MQRRLDPWKRRGGGVLHGWLRRWEQWCCVDWARRGDRLGGRERRRRRRHIGRRRFRRRTGEGGRGAGRGRTAVNRRRYLLGRRGGWPCVLARRSPLGE